MTELTEEPYFKVGECVDSYSKKSKRGNPDSALIVKGSYNYLESLIYQGKDGLVYLRNSAGVIIRVYRAEELSPRKRAKLEAINGLPLYLCQTGIWERIKTKSIRHYNLGNTTTNLRES